MSGSCVCIDVDAGNIGFVRDRMVKARTYHYCTECGRKIEPGEQYEYVFGVWEGESSVYKTCEDCLSVRHEFYCGTWYYGQVWEYVWETIQEVYDIGIDQLEGLTKRARENVVEYIDEIMEEERLDEE